jgi:hypothetical protein
MKAFTYLTIAIVSLLTNVAGYAQTPSPVRFAFVQKDPAGQLRTFVFELTDPARIAEARSIIADPRNPRHQVQGTVVQKKAPYNPEWSFHLAPASIGFFEKAIEVCDANVTYVEKRLDEVGGSFLPKSHWCPWSSRLDRELP